MTNHHNCNGEEIHKNSLYTKLEKMLNFYSKKGNWKKNWK